MAGGRRRGLIRLIDDPRHEMNSDGTYNLSEEQARAILDLRLQRLTALGREEISDELNQLADEIKDYLAILGSRERVMEIIRNELSRSRPPMRRRAAPRSSSLTATWKTKT